MSDPQAGECPPRSRWKGWRGKLRASRIARSRTRHQANPCRMNCGMQSWPIRAPLDDRHCRSSNFGSRKFRAMCCASSACAASELSKFRRRMPSDFMGRMPSGRMSGSGCSIKPVPIAQAGTKKMDAGRIGSSARNCRQLGPDFRGTTVYTDEGATSKGLSRLYEKHESANHSIGEYCRGKNGFKRSRPI